MRYPSEKIDCCKVDIVGSCEVEFLRAQRKDRTTKESDIFENITEKEKMEQELNYNFDDEDLRLSTELVKLVEDWYMKNKVAIIQELEAELIQYEAEVERVEMKQEEAEVAVGVTDIKQVLPTSSKNKKMKPSVEESPNLELKSLPDFLKYAFLGPERTFSIIISVTLEPEQDKQLLAILKECKLALGWTIADINGISSIIYMHKILMQDNAEHMRNKQRRLNPLMTDVVKKEVHKLLDFGMIFPILDSEQYVQSNVCLKKVE